MTDGDRVLGRGRPGEPRLPMALAVLAAAGLYVLIPKDFLIAEVFRFLYPTLLVLLLVLLISGDPGRIDKERPWLRTTTGLLIAVMAFGIAVSAVRLVVGILNNAHFTAPAQLLTIGAAIWSTNVITFALVYWHLDSGGPVARSRGTATTPAGFRFPEHDIDDVMRSGWYPQFVDYLALSFYTATAFSAADVSAVRHWSKLCLMAESAMSLVLVALVVARAVNIL